MLIVFRVMLVGVVLLSLGLPACRSSAPTSNSTRTAPNETGVSSTVSEDLASGTTEPSEQSTAVLDAAESGVLSDQPTDVLDDAGPEALSSDQPTDALDEAEPEGNSELVSPSAIGIPPAEALARHLTRTGAQMYGAYWCTECTEQKAKFGDAFEYIDYVECDPQGENPRTQLCLDTDIEAFPTWRIRGEAYVGTHSLEELATLSGYGVDRL